MAFSAPVETSAAAGDTLHREVEARLMGADQRYTQSRRVLVEVLAAAGRPLSIPEILGAALELPQSSAYRNLGVLAEAGVTHRVVAADGIGRFELTEELSGHHHHLVCGACGSVTDVTASPRLEQVVEEICRLAAEEADFEVSGHRIDLVGLCGKCS